MILPPQRRKAIIDQWKVEEGSPYERVLTQEQSQDYVKARRDAANDDEAEERMYNLIDTARAQAKQIFGL